MSYFSHHWDQIPDRKPSREGVLEYLMAGYMRLGLLESLKMRKEVGWIMFKVCVRLLTHKTCP